MAADKKYKGERIQVFGIVTDIKVVLGKPFVTMKARDLPDFREVQCDVEKPYLDRASSLRPGQWVTIRGW